MTALDQQRIAEWIGDAFAILCVRTGGVSEAETNLRLGFETILRELRIPPLRVVAKVAPVPYHHVSATTGEFRQILKALDSCLAIFNRYNGALSPAQRDVQRLVQATRQHAEQELASRRTRVAELAPA